MTPAEAKTALAFHSSAHHEIEDDRWTTGFLGSLRPYKGRLIEGNFHDIMAALRVLASELGDGETVDRAVMRDVLTITHLGRAWGVHPDGMLRRNGLISDADVATLERGIECIQNTVTLLLDGMPDEAFADYEAYDEDANGAD